jgi:hypothetical protein
VCYLTRTTHVLATPDRVPIDRQAAECYRKVIDFIRSHPDDYEQFAKLVEQLDPPVAT